MDPFAQMRAQMQRMQQEMMTGMPMDDPFMDDPFIAQGRGTRRTQDATGGVQIEEVEDERATAPGRQQPIVEEPDDPHQAAAARQLHQQRQYEEQMRAQRQRERQSHAYPMQQMQMSPFGFPDFSGGLLGQMMNFPSFPMGASGSGTSYSYSSSTFTSSGGPNGVTYQETKTSRRGPGGVLEESHSVRDGRTGEEKMKLTRGLGERQRTLEQQRRNGEQVQRTEHLKGFRSPEEAQRFDSEWQSQAAGNLMPGFGDGSRRRPRIQGPAIGFGDASALSGPGDDMARQSDRFHTRPHPAAHRHHPQQNPENFYDPRFREI